MLIEGTTHPLGMQGLVSGPGRDTEVGSYCKVTVTAEVCTGLGEYLSQGCQAGGSVPGNLVDIVGLRHHAGVDWGTPSLKLCRKRQHWGVTALLNVSVRKWPSLGPHQIPDVSGEDTQHSSSSICQCEDKNITVGPLGSPESGGAV